MLKRIFLKSACLAIVLFVSIFFYIGLQTSQAEDIKKLSITTGPIGGSWYPIGGAVAEIIKRHTPYTMDVMVGGGMVNIERVDKGDADIGMGNGFAVVDAFHAKREPFAEHPRKNVANMFTFTKTTLQIAVRKDSEIKSILDLKGKAFAPGKPAYSQRFVFSDVLRAYNMKYEDLGRLFQGGFSDSAMQMKDGHVEGMIALTLVPATVYTELETTTPFNLISLPEDKIKQILSYNSGYIRQEIQADTYKVVDHSISGVGTSGSLIIRRDLPNDVVYNITKTLVENISELGEVHASLKGIDPEFCATDIGVPFHPGAEKYYKEIGILD